MCGRVRAEVQGLLGRDPGGGQPRAGGGPGPTRPEGGRGSSATTATGGPTSASSPPVPGGTASVDGGSEACWQPVGWGRRDCPGAKAPDAKFVSHGPVRTRRGVGRPWCLPGPGDGPTEGPEGLAPPSRRPRRPSPGGVPGPPGGRRSGPRARAGAREREPAAAGKNREKRHYLAAESERLWWRVSKRTGPYRTRGATGATGT